MHKLDCAPRALVPRQADNFLPHEPVVEKTQPVEKKPPSDGSSHMIGC